MLNNAKLAIALIIALLAGAAVGYEGSVVSTVPATTAVTITQFVTTTSVTTSTVTQTVSGASELSSSMNGSLKITAGENSSVALQNSAWDGGYLWQVSSIDNPGVVRLVANQTYPGSSSPGLVGGPAETQVFTFKALGAGSAVVTLQLVRPWLPNAPIGRYLLYVIVMP